MAPLLLLELASLLIAIAIVNVEHPLIAGVDASTIYPSLQYEGAVAGAAAPLWVLFPGYVSAEPSIPNGVVTDLSIDVQQDLVRIGSSYQLPYFHGQACTLKLSDGEVWCYSQLTDEKRRIYSTSSVASSANGKWLALYGGHVQSSLKGGQSKITTYDTESWANRDHLVNGTSFPILGRPTLRMSKDGRILAYSSVDDSSRSRGPWPGRVGWMEVATGKVLGEVSLELTDGGIWMDDNGTRLLTREFKNGNGVLNTSGVLTTISLPSGRVISRVSCELKAFLPGISPTGQFVLAASTLFSDSPIHLFNTDTGSRAWSFEANRGSLKVLKTGRKFAVAVWIEAEFATVRVFTIGQASLAVPIYTFQISEYVSRYLTTSVALSDDDRDLFVAFGKVGIYHISLGGAAPPQPKMVYSYPVCDITSIDVARSPKRGLVVVAGLERVIRPGWCRDGERHDYSQEPGALAAFTVV